jgi:hypothetical protein
MSEPTFRQHKILEKIAVVDEVYRTGKEDDIELYWELVRAGYLKNLVNITGPYDWTFRITEQAEDYLSKNK